MKLTTLMVTTALMTATLVGNFVESADAQRRATRYSSGGSATTNGIDFDDFFGSFAIFEEGIEDEFPGITLINQGDNLIAQGNDLVNEGDDLIAQGEDLLSQGQTAQGEALISQGGALISQGQDLIFQGEELRSQGEEGTRQSLFPGAIAFYIEDFDFDISGGEGRTEFANLDLFVTSFGNDVFYEFQDQGSSVAVAQGTFNSSDINSATNDLFFIANNFPLSEELFPNSSGSTIIDSFNEEQETILIGESQSVPESNNSIFTLLAIGTLGYGLWQRPRKV